VPVPMPEEEMEEETGVEVIEDDGAEGGEEVPGTVETAPEAGEARVEATVQVGDSPADTEKSEREE